MKKYGLMSVVILLVFTLIGCTQITDEKAMALQEQYDNYRMNEFSDDDAFADYLNTFSLETMHAGIEIHIQYHQTGSESVLYETFGVIVEQDLTHYYVATTSTYFTEELRREVIFVYDVYDNMYSANKVLVDEDLGIALLSFQKNEALEIVSFSEYLPMNDELVMVLSHSNDIRFDMSLGYFATDTIQFTTDTHDDVISGVIFDINHDFLGIIYSSSGEFISAADIKIWLNDII